MARGYNPFAPIGPRGIRQEALGYIQPLIDALNKDFARRTAAGQASIRASTESLANALAPLEARTQANYTQALHSQQEINDALANRLAGFGGNMAQGASNAGFAMGSANLGQLVAQGAAARQYSAAQPNIARMAGAQQANQFGGKLETERNTQEQTIRAQIPKLIQDLTNRELQKAVANQSGIIQTAKINQQTAKMNQQASQFAQKQQQQLSEFNSRENRLANQALISNGFTRQRIGLSQDQYNLAVKREAAWAKHLKQGSSRGQHWTLNEISTMKGKADIGAGHLKAGYDSKDVQGNIQHHPPVDARHAFLILLHEGIPPLIAFRAVGNHYGKWLKPGEAKALGIPGQ